ncbi:MAG: hypothetical protein V4649_12990 [Bacteroidota bacterium]
MQTGGKDTTIDTLHEIRSIMDRSSRFLSLSGWSGIWAGCVALAGACVAYSWLHDPVYANADYANTGTYSYSEYTIIRFFILAIAVFSVALAGGYYFTYRKAKRQEQTLWSPALRQMLLQLFFPVLVGGIFSIVFISHGNMLYIAPVCLAFYGLALISAGKYTHSDIRYLGMLQVLLGCICFLKPGWGLYFWAAGFGVLHILYGVIMWNKYDK